MSAFLGVAAYWVLVMLAGLAVVDAIPFDWRSTERLAAAVIVGTIVSTIVSFVASLWIGVTPATALSGPLLVVVVAGLSRRYAWARNIAHLPDALRARSWSALSHTGLAWRVAVFGAVGVGFWLLFAHALAPVHGTLVAFSGPVWSDWSLHATLAQSYLLGHNLPPLDPFKAGSPLHYPYLDDFQPALLEALGQDLWGALDIPSFVVAVAAAILIWHAAWRVLGRKEVAASLALTLVLFGGSLGFVGLFPDGCQQLVDTTHAVSQSDCDHLSSATPLTALEVVGHLPSELLHLPRYYDGEPFTGVLTAPSLPDLEWQEPLLVYWMPQRDFAFGMGMVALAVTLGWVAVRERARPLLVAAGALGGLMPLFNPFGLLIVAGVVGVWLIWRRWWAGLIPFLIPLVVLGAVPLAIVAGGASSGAESFPLLDLGWFSHYGTSCTGAQLATAAHCTGLYLPGSSVGDMATYVVQTLGNPRFYAGLVGFWLANTGVFIPLGIAAAALVWFGRGRLNREAKELDLVVFALPFWLVFAFANLVITQSDAWDNTKWFQYWYLGAAIPVAWLLTSGRRALWRVLSALLAVTLIATGVLTTVVAIHGQSSLSEGPLVSARENWADPQVQTVAAAVERETSPGAVFLTQGQVDDPVLAVAGRSSVLGFDGWWFENYGQPLSVTIQAVTTMYAGCPDTGSCQVGRLLRQYDVSYVEFEPAGYNGIVGNQAWYAAQHLPVLVQTPEYTIYRVRGLWAPSS
jgi:hypothetical protein